MKWPWTKRTEKEDKSWEALSESRETLDKTLAEWPKIREVSSEVKAVTVETRLKREQNHFPELWHNILYGGRK